MQSGKIFNVRLQIVDPTLRSWMNLLPDEEVHYDVQITLSSDPITLQRVFTVSQVRRFLRRTSCSSCTAPSAFRRCWQQTAGLHQSVGCRLKPRAGGWAHAERAAREKRGATRLVRAPCSMN